MRSIRSFSHARTERGFALIAALALAILYFALMELLLVDSSRALMEARQFRARVVAATVAENAAELAALNMRIAPITQPARESDEQGDMVGTLTMNAPSFSIEGEGETTGVIRQKARVVVDGEINLTTGLVSINYTNHSQ